MIRACTSCGKSNNVPAARLSERARCGSCKASLAPLGEPLDVGPEAFREIAKGAQLPLLVDFWAPWCGPCRMAAPEVARVARDLAGEAIVLKVDTEKHPELAALFKVRSIPTFAVLNRGDLVQLRSGLVDHREMKRWLQAAKQ